MIVASLDQLPDHLREPDIAIVGAGAVGIALAVQLARKGLRVVVAEGGANRPPLDFRAANTALSTGRPHLGLVEGRMKALGGTTRLWGGQLMTFDSNDLSAGIYPDKPGWPITYAELSDYTRQATELLKIPPDLQDGKTLHQQVSEHDLWRDGKIETAIATWLSQPDFVRLFATDLADLPNLAVVTGHRLHDLERSAPGQFSALILRDSHGREHRLSAGRTVLANGTFELVGTLLRLARNPENCIAGSAHIGRWFIDHLHAIGGTIRRVDRRRLADLMDPVLKGGYKYSVKLKLSPQLQRDAGIPNVAAMVLAPLSLREILGGLGGLARRGKVSGQPAQSSGFFRTSLMLAPLIWRYLVKRRGPSLWSDHALLGIEIEQAVSSQSRITLDPEDPDRLVLHWAIDGTAEMRAARVFCEAAREFLSGHGLGDLEIDHRIIAQDPDFLDDAHDAYHQMGGARMATGPDSGVVDSDLKVFGTDNLYALGAATFPSGSFANPTLTALALAVRLADHIGKGEMR